MKGKLVTKNVWLSGMTKPRQATILRIENKFLFWNWTTYWYQNEAMWCRLEFINSHLFMSVVEIPKRARTIFMLDAMYQRLKRS